MSTIEIILSRAMNEPEFAQQLLANAEKALQGYDLSADERAQIKSISHAQFNAMTLEERKSLASTATVRGGGFFQMRDQGG